MHIIAEVVKPMMEALEIVYVHGGRQEGRCRCVKFQMHIAEAEYKS